MGPDMPLQTGERAIVHVVDDDAPIRDALEGLFDTVGLGSQTYAAARDFMAASLTDEPGCIVIDIRLPESSEAVGVPRQGENANSDNSRH
jgi:FixJ family two-component response regulator